MHLNQTELWCASEGDHLLGAESSLKLGHTLDVILEALRLNFLFYAKFTSRKTTAAYFLYTSCHLHAHLMRVLGSKIPYENHEE